MEFTSLIYLWPNHSPSQTYILLWPSSLPLSPSHSLCPLTPTFSQQGYCDLSQLSQTVGTETRESPQVWQSLGPNQQNCVKKTKNIRGKKNKKIQQKLNLKSARKNSELNIINKLVYFLKDNHKSQDTLKRALAAIKLTPTPEVINAFYFTIEAVLGPRMRKYLNTPSLKQLMQPDYLMLHHPELTDAYRTAGSLLSLAQFCSLFRRIARHFLQTACVSAILTSKRITNITLPVHVRKLRTLLAALAQ